MGCPSRSDYHHLISHSTRNRRRTRTPDGTIYLLPCVEHGTVLVRRHHWLDLPLLFDTEGSGHALYLSYAPNPLSITSSQHFFVPGIPIWLCQPRSHRLPHLYPGQILQASTGHDPSFDNLPQKIPTLQIRCCTSCDVGRGNFYSAPPRYK